MLKIYFNTTRYQLKVTVTLEPGGNSPIYIIFFYLLVDRLNMKFNLDSIPSADPAFNVYTGEYAVPKPHSLP